LAAALQAKFGPDVALVGKAVALISMMAAEFIFVFHEKASSYTSRTQVMNNLLRENGIALHLHPMLRLQYSTWNSLAEVEAQFHLPPHLARAFDEIPFRPANLPLAGKKSVTSKMPCAVLCASAPRRAN
jgi:hypothetical protein